MRIYDPASKPTGVRPRFLRALGASDPPEWVEIGGQRYRRVDIFKHDSWAATALYASPRERVVCKFNRQQSLFGVPMRWLGRWLAGREARLLKALSDLEGVPEPVGPVFVGGKRQRHAVGHEFVPGHPVRATEPVGDRFFPQLEQTLRALHRRGIAYVDLHKNENILVGEDGLPHLIDFQVSFHRPRSRLLARLTNPLERGLQDLDLYHLQKHLCWKRPDLAGRDYAAFNQQVERPLWLRVHRALATPFRRFRRRLLVLLGVRKGPGLAASEHFPEAAHRRDQPDLPLSRRQAA